MFGQSAGTVSSVIVSLYSMTRKPLTDPSVFLRRGTAKDAEPLVLRHENAVRVRLRRSEASQNVAWAALGDSESTGRVRGSNNHRSWSSGISVLVDHTAEDASAQDFTAGRLQDRSRTGVLIG
ncbi:hypothetical protein DNK48_36580 [Streptomyces malaysiensis subsp. malaysiensis]|nr:hypothetical protein DNK48_36580 [Streptomyces malaysiensis]